MMFNTGKVIGVIAAVIFAKMAFALEADDVFSDPAITKSVHKNILPKGYTFADGIWRDDHGKAIEKPNVNFAGKYWVGLYSCGAECRYYSMLDLTTGTESRALDMFSTTEPPSRTRNGNLYVTNLVTHAKSNRLVARYHVILNKPDGEECWERVFILKEVLLVPLTKMNPECNAQHSASQ